MMSERTTVTNDELRVTSAERATTGGADGAANHLPPAVSAPFAVRRPSLVARLTVADGLMALIGGVAALARLVDLSRLPLSPAEAGAALASWQFANGGQVAAPVSSPAYFTFTSLIMGLGGSGDVAARLAPVLFGVATVLLPWLWRGRARPALWLTAALFLAVSPLHVAVSRAAGGEAIALFALLLLVVAGGRRWWGVAGAALGLGLTSAPLFYTGLVALVPAWWIFAGANLMDRRRLDGAPAGDWVSQWRRIGVAAALAFVAVGSCLLFYPAGFGAALQLLPTWFAQFGLPANLSASGLLSPLLTLLRYEPALLMLGLPAAVWAVRRGDRPGIRLGIWLGLVLLIATLQPAHVANTAAAVLPGYLLVGLFAAHLARASATSEKSGLSQRTTWFVAGGLLLLGMVLLVSIGRFTRLNLWTGEQGTLVGLATLAFVFAGLVVILALSWDNSAARLGAFLGVALLLLYWQWGTGWQLNQIGANDPRERWVVEAADDDVPVMMELITNISLQTTNAADDLAIFSLIESPVLRWYFRDFARFQTGPALPVNAQTSVVLAPDDRQLAHSGDYFGVDFGLTQRDVADAVAAPAPVGTRIADLLRWWLFRESTAPVDGERLILWIRSDLATAGELSGVTP
ncbi:hypothetical protein [Promineifilum sp.]|uniref:hypothetical protein n=1 Tax=Promineifilum sp. TaxID=2664178 RepID=UPI0035AE9A53